MLFSGAMVLVVAFGQAARGADDSDETKIRGTWQLVSKTQKGFETKIDAIADGQPVVFTFEAQGWKVKVGPNGALVDKSGTYALDSKQTPKQLDLTIQGDTAVTDAPAIYKFERDRLYIRLREDAGQRPPDFEIAADDCVTLVFRQVK
jgi:uncharacterized protein (TIGR03067 family)